MNTSRFVRSWPAPLCPQRPLRFCRALSRTDRRPPRNQPPLGRPPRKKPPKTRPSPTKFAAWKATLSPEQQAWETLLEQNLGGFYLPLYQREKVRGSVSAWDYVKDDPSLPRVLLIGDSVSRGYTLAARKALAGKANVHRAPENCGPTANGLKKLDVWLGDGKWDVIHFNFGIHDRATKPADYEQRLETIVTRLKATGAKVIWASTTPIPPDTKDGPAAAEAIVEKNRIAAERDGEARRRDRRPVHLHHAAPGEGAEPEGRPLQRRGLRIARQAGRGVPSKLRSSKSAPDGEMRSWQEYDGQENGKHGSSSFCQRRRLLRGFRRRYLEHVLAIHVRADHQRRAGLRAGFEELAIATDGGGACQVRAVDFRLGESRGVPFSTVNRSTGAMYSAVRT